MTKVLDISAWQSRAVQYADNAHFHVDFPFYATGGSVKCEIDTEMDMSRWLALGTGWQYRWRLIRGIFAVCAV